MGLSLDISHRVRTVMVEEIELDVVSEQLYLSDRLSECGRGDYPLLLLEAAHEWDDAWLAEQLELAGRINAMTTRRKPKGGYTSVRVPYDAAQTLAAGEFNRYYIRAVCRIAIEDGIERVVVYRAKAVANPRRESETRIGARIDAAQLLADLRAHIGIDTALGVPAGPNSGLSVRLGDGRG